MTPESRLLTPHQLAQILNVPVAWCWKAARSGQLPHVRLPGGRQFIRFDLSAVESALKNNGNEGNPKGTSSESQER